MTENIIVAIGPNRTRTAPLRWAVERAGHTGATVELLTVIERSWAETGDVPSDELIDAAEGLLGHMRDRALALSPGVHVALHWVYGRAATELTSASSRSDIMVLGAHRYSTGEPGFVSSLSARVASAASSTVVAVPNDWTEQGTGTVVGVDGSPSATAALAFAADEAARYREHLTLVCGGYSANPLLEGLVPSATTGGHRERVLAAAVASVLTRRPDLPVTSTQIEAAPAEALTRASVGARLLAVGHRERHGVNHLLGSVSHDVLLNLQTPVAVVRTRE